MKNAFVTGASGFIGRAIVSQLLTEGYRVRALLRATSPSDHLPVEVESVTGDMCDVEAFALALRGCDVLFHCAADYALYTRKPAHMYQVNVDGTESLIRAAFEAGVERIVYTSSVATLSPSPDGNPADETSLGKLENMHGHYKRSKFLAEQRVLRLVEEEALPIIIVNPAAPVGPGDAKPTPTGQTILDAMHGNMPAYVDTGLDIVHVEDVAMGHLLALKLGTPARYILGGENMTLKAILELISKETGRPPPRVRLPYSLVLLLAYCSECLARLTGTLPRVPLAGVQLAKHRMFFSSARARDELGYRSRPGYLAISDAINWFQSEAFKRGIQTKSYWKLLAFSDVKQASIVGLRRDITNRPTAARESNTVKGRG